MTEILKNTQQTQSSTSSFLQSHKKEKFPSSKCAEIENLFTWNVPGSAEKLRNHRWEHHFHVIYESESIERRFMTCFLFKWLRKYYGRVRPSSWSRKSGSKIDKCMMWMIFILIESSSISVRAKEDEEEKERQTQQHEHKYKKFFLLPIFKMDFFFAFSLDNFSLVEFQIWRSFLKLFEADLKCRIVWFVGMLFVNTIF